MSQRRRRQPTQPEPTPSYTVDQLEALDRQVQMTQDQRHLAHLTVTGASVPETGAPLYPGVPEGSTFAPLPAGMSPVFPEVVG